MNWWQYIVIGLLILWVAKLQGRVLNLQDQVGKFAHEVVAAFEALKEEDDER